MQNLLDKQLLHIFKLYIMQFPHDEYNTSNMLNKDRSIAFVESDKV